MSVSNGLLGALAQTVQRALADAYVIERELKGGSMSRVFVAEEVELRRRVVIKVLRPELAAELSMERFAREIRLLAGLQQANIIPVLRAGQVDGLPYYTMPFVEGQSLKERLAQDGPLAIPAALDVLRDVAKGLAFAHAHSVVHRDIKPANILLSGGTAVVIDFGIAKAMQHAGPAGLTNPSLTQAGFGVGTPAYIAPEQAACDPDVDHRADLYAWGVVAYELLTGAHPFADRKEPHQLIAAHLSVRPASIGGVGRDIPIGAAAIIMQCLEKDPNDRPQDAAALVAALGGRETELSGAHSAPGYTSIAVLPFANVGGNAEDEYLSDGMSDEVMHALAKLDGLRVVSRTSAFEFKGRHQDVRTIGSALGASCLLEGTVRRAGTRLRVTAQLVDATEGLELWSERYDREFTDAFDVQDEISRAIVGTLRVELLRHPQSRRPRQAPSVAAYDLYLKGRFQWNQRTEAALGRSLEYFDGAIATDPDFLPAHTGRAAVYVMLAIYGALPPHQAMPAARTAAERVLAADPRSAIALAARGSVRALYDLDLAGAEEGFRLAIDADPSSSTPYHWYAMHCLVPAQRFAEAAPLLARARTLDPLAPAVATSVGILRYFQRKYAEADRLLEEVLDRHPRFALALYFRGQVYTQTGDHARAIEALSDASAITHQSPEVESARGFALGRGGDITAARDTLAHLLTVGHTRYISPVHLAQVCIGLGEPDAALAHLDRAVTLRAAELPLLSIRPAFDSLRGIPRFDALIQRLAGGYR